MSQYKRPTQSGGMPPRGNAPASRPAARPVTVQGSANPNARPATAVRPAAQAQRPANGTARPAQQTAARRNPSRLPYDFKPLVGAAALLLILGVAAHLMFPNGFNIDGGAVEVSVAVSEIHGSGPIRLNELMSSNDSTAVDENGVTADWIEVINIGEREINLAGYSLAKNQNAANVFTFPEHVLQPGECAIVYADSTISQTAGSAYHAPFRLSSKGGSLMLFNASGTAIDSVNFPAMAADMSYVRQDQSVWSASNMATPGLSNGAESYTALHQVRTDTGVEITEIVSSNVRTLADESGEYYDYFELHNTTGQAIDLSGWFVSDAAARPTRWRLPQGFVLQAGEYRVVYASGLNREDAAYPHANFGLSSEGEEVVLADNTGRIADRVEFALLGKDSAWKKNADGTWSSGTPTPGAAN